MMTYWQTSIFILYLRTITEFTVQAANNVLQFITICIRYNIRWHDRLFPVLLHSAEVCSLTPIINLYFFIHLLVSVSFCISQISFAHPYRIISLMLFVDLLNGKIIMFMHGNSTILFPLTVKKKINKLCIAL